MLHSRYSEEELQELLWEFSSSDDKLRVVNRSGWEDELTYGKRSVVVWDYETEKHYRVYFNRYGNDYEGYTYTVNDKTPEVQEKVISYKVWEDIGNYKIIE